MFKLLKKSYVLVYVVVVLTTQDIYAGNLNIEFRAFVHDRLEQINVNNTDLLAPGCGFYIVGGFDNKDTVADNVTSCNAINGILNNQQNVNIPFELHFVESGTNYIDFGVTIDARFATLSSLSLPLDARKDLFTHFRFSNGDMITQGTLYEGSEHRYELLKQTYVTESGGQVNIGRATSHENWVELISPEYTLRYEITGVTRPLSLYFVDHSGINVRNGEFSFGGFSNEIQYVTGRITVLETDPDFYVQYFEAESDFYHQIGRREGSGWSVNVNDPKWNYLAYGPYTALIYPGYHTAYFSLLLDNVRADNNQILRIDVYDASRNAVLASKVLRRTDFSENFTYKYFPLSFISSTGANLEFRVLYLGSSYVKFDKVMVR